MKKLVLSKNLILISAILACTMPTWGQGDEKSKTNKPLVVFVTGDHEYGSESTMPLLAAELEKKLWHAHHRAQNTDQTKNTPAKRD